MNSREGSPGLQDKQDIVCGPRQNPWRSSLGPSRCRRSSRSPSSQSATISHRRQPPAGASAERAPGGRSGTVWASVGAREICSRALYTFISITVWHHLLIAKKPLQMFLPKDEEAGNGLGESGTINALEEPPGARLPVRRNFSILDIPDQ